MRDRHRGRILLTALAVAALLLLARAFQDPEHSEPIDEPGAHRAAVADTGEAAQTLQRRTDASTSASVAHASRDDAPEFEPGPARGDRAGESDDADRSDTEKLQHNTADPIFVEPLVIAADAPTVRIQGFDPDGPRDLVAWRIKGARRAIAARGTSNEQGELEFPRLIAPRDGLEIVVTDANGAPGGPGASPPRRLEPRLPVAPHATLLDSGDFTHVVRIVPSEASGTVLLADADGEVFASYRVHPTPVASSRPLDVEVSLGELEDHFLMAHVFDDGRQSDWRVMQVAPPEPLE